MVVVSLAKLPGCVFQVSRVLSFSRPLNAVDTRGRNGRYRGQEKISVALRGDETTTTACLHVEGRRSCGCAGLVRSRNRFQDLLDGLHVEFTVAPAGVLRRVALGQHPGVVLARALREKPP